MARPSQPQEGTEIVLHHKYLAQATDCQRGSDRKGQSPWTSKGPPPLGGVGEKRGPVHHQPEAWVLCVTLAEGVLQGLASSLHSVKWRVWEPCPKRGHC